jgi:hypothetical protein
MEDMSDKNIGMGGKFYHDNMENVVKALAGMKCIVKT